MVVAAGLKTGAAPDVEYVPPHETVYHLQIAPSLLKLPPTMPKVDGAPAQVIDGVENAEVGIVENELTVTMVLMHAVVLHIPSALTK